MKKKGFVHIYTGNGKGKTTASLGLALRAFGAGKKVFIAQFAKTGESAEIKVIRERLPEITVKQYGLDHFIMGDPGDDDITAAKQGLAEVSDVIFSGKYNLVILDEINIALYFNLIDIEEVKRLIINIPSNIEIVLTGRNAPLELVELADLVTEMKEIKHYYTKGVDARKGIEF
jgi:cob(I)alamin adenosyltransferase